MISGILFFGVFASLAAVPSIAAFLHFRARRVTFFISIIVATALLSFFHHDYDLSSDAQAAIGLIFIPWIVMIATGVITFIVGMIESKVQKKTKMVEPDGVDNA